MKTEVNKITMIEQMTDERIQFLLKEIEQDRALGLLTNDDIRLEGRLEREAKRRNEHKDKS